MKKEENIDNQTDGISNLSCDLEQELKKFVADFQELEELEGVVSKFNIFEALNIVNNEIRHSSVLAWLFNPYESHNYDDGFFRLFMRSLLSSVEVEGFNIFEIDEIDYSDVQVIREWNRIDIAVFIRDKNKEIVLAIENKVWADEHNDQLSVYYNRLKDYQLDQNKAGINVILIPVYLNPKQKDPTDKRWFKFSYEQISEIINYLYEKNKGKSDQTAELFVCNYLDIIRRFIMKDDKEIREICNKIYRKHRKAIDLIIDNIVDAVGETKSLIYEKIKKTNGITINADNSGMIRFTSPAIDAKIKYYANNLGKGDNPLLSYVIDFYKSDEHLRADIKIIIFGGVAEERENLYRHFVANKELFNKAKNKLTAQFNTVYTHNLIPTAKRNKDFDITLDQGMLDPQLKRDLLKNFEKFMTEEFPKLEAYIMEFEG